MYENEMRIKEEEYLYSLTQKDGVSHNTTSCNLLQYYKTLLFELYSKILVNIIFISISIFYQYMYIKQYTVNTTQTTLHRIILQNFFGNDNLEW